MPDEDKTTNTNQPLAGEVPSAGQPNPTVTPTTPTPSPTTTPDISGQAIDAPPPPPMVDGAVSPPPPIVEEKKPEGTAAPIQETGAAESTQAIPDIPPVITTSGTGGKKPVNKKMIATILGVLVLVGGIGAGVILVQNQQDIREKAGLIEDAGLNIDDTEPSIPLPPSMDDDGDDDNGGGNETTTCAGGVSVGVHACSDYYTCVLCLPNGTYSGSVDTANCEGLPCGPATPTCTNDKIEFCERSGKDCLNNECVSAGNLDYGRTCTEDDQCHSGICTNGACAAPSTRFCDANTCDLNNVDGADLSDTCFIMHYSSDDSNDSTITDNVIAQGVSRASLGAVDCGAEQIDVACFGSGFIDGIWKRYPSDCTDPSDPTDPTDPTSAGECYNVKAFDTEWNSITTLSSLVAGDVVRFTVSGNTNSGSFSKARFTINGTLRSEVSGKRPGTEEFYDEYIIPEGVTTFTINAEIYHSSLGWF